MTPKRAYSYVRFSRPEQMRGDSLRRQMQLAEDYVAEKGFVLDTSLKLQDLGVSAFTGKNRTEGALGGFIEACRTGKVPHGSVLLVESLDRLSRDQVGPALQHFLEMTQTFRLEIHTLFDRKIYNKDSEATDIIISITYMQRAWEESETKKKRGNAVWTNKKQNSKPGVSISARMPNWLSGKAGDPIKVHPQRAGIVRRIFEMSAEGMGRRMICQTLNKQKIPSFGVPQWLPSYVGKILNNRIVLGEYQPCKRIDGVRIEDGAIRENFFPAIITPELWQRAHAAIASRLIVCDQTTPNVKRRYVKRRAPDAERQRDEKISNLFTGLVTDANLGAPMHYEHKGQRARPKLASYTRHISVTPHKIDYAKFEDAFLGWIKDFDWRSLEQRSDELKTLETAEAQLLLEEERNDKMIVRFRALLQGVEAPPENIVELMTNAEAKKREIKTQLALNSEEIRSAKAKVGQLQNTDSLYSAVFHQKDREARLRLRQEIRNKITDISMDFEPKPIAAAQRQPTITKISMRSAMKRIGYRIPEQPIAIVTLTFVNGATRTLTFFDTDGKPNFLMIA